MRGDELIDRRLAGGRKVLGICVGMQVLFERGVERGVDSEGLGEWPGVVTELEAPVLPHMGWNTVDAAEDSVLFDGIRDERFYFVHSYAAQDWTLDVMPPVPAAADHLGRTRRPLPRSGRERPAVGHPVPPREVGRGRHPSAPQLDRVASRLSSAADPFAHPGYYQRAAVRRRGTEDHMSEFHTTPGLVLLPAVDVADGKAVRLTQGEAGTETNYGDPVAGRGGLGRRRAPSGSTSSTSTPPSAAATTSTCCAA